MTVDAQLRVWVNGRLTSTLDVADRGLSYGDGVFETMLCVDHRVPLLSRHLERMEQSCRALRIPFDRVAWQHDIDAALAVTPVGRCVLKLVHTRGAGGVGYQPGELSTPTRVLQQLSYPVADPRELNCAVLQTQLGANPMLAGHKHLNRLEQVMAAQELTVRGLDEGLVCDINGFVIEAVSANVLLVFDDRIVTPPVQTAGVSGVMRSLLIERSQVGSFPIVEEFVYEEAVGHAQEIVLCNSVRGVRRVAKIGERVLNRREHFARLCGVAEAALSATSELDR